MHGDAAYVEGIFKDDFERKNSTYFVSGNPENKPAKEINEDDILFGYGYPNIKVTPAEIFSNKISMLDANYFKSDYKDEVGGNERSIAYKLKKTVSSWYNTLRMIAIVGLLSVLVYLGIRIIISSAASDQAKYKMMLKDWVVALCLIFFLHYIMAFTMTMVEEAVNVICSEDRNNNETIAKQVYVIIKDDYKDEDETIENINNNDDYLTFNESEGLKLSDYFTSEEVTEILDEYNNDNVDSSSSMNSSGMKSVMFDIMARVAPEETMQFYRDVEDVKLMGADSIYSEENKDEREYILIDMKDGATYYNASDFTYANGVLTNGSTTIKFSGDSGSDPKFIVNYKALLEKFARDTGREVGNVDNTAQTQGTTGTAKGAQDVSFYTNLTGYMRLCVENKNFGPKLAATVMYLALTLYTLYFIFVYLKRLLMLTFLTLIAPLVALTYPIDKVKDGKAQAFNFWLKEYIANAMLPIIHSILYQVLVESSIDLVVASPLYAIFALAFIMPAEKIVKAMFGISSQTAPALGGFAGGALTATLLQKLGKKGSGGKDSKSSSGGNNSKIRMKPQGIKTDFSDFAQPYASGTTTTRNTTPQTTTQTAPVNGGGAGQPPETTPTNGGGAGQPPATTPTNGGGAGQPTATTSTNVTNPVPPSTPIGQPKTDSFSYEKPKLRTRAKNFATTVGSNGKRMFMRRFGLTEGKAIRQIAARAGKGAVKGLARATFAGIGLAGGIVSGDMNDMWKGMAGGFVAGNMVGNNISNKLTGVPGRTADFFTELGGGEEAAARKAYTRDFMNDEETIEYMRKKYSKESVARQKEVMRKMSLLKMSGAADDVKTLDRLVKLQEKDENEINPATKEKKYSPEMAVKRAIYRGKFAKVVGSKKDVFASGKYKDFIKTKTQELINQGVPEQQAAQVAEELVNDSKYILDL